MGKLSRDKGKRGEREVVALLKEHGFEARRGQQFRGGPDSPDVIHNMDGFFIEVKLKQQLNLFEVLEQTYVERGVTDKSLVFHRKDHKPWLVTMDAREFLELMKEDYHGLRARP